MSDDIQELDKGSEQLTELQVRQYRPEDRDDIWELSCRALDPVFPNPKRIKGPRQADFDNIPKFYSPKDRADFLVGIVDKKIVAIVGLQQSSERENVAELRRWRVDPDYQRRGYGTKMLQAIEERAREFGYNTIQAITVNLLEGAVGQYSKNGYQEVKREHLPEKWQLDGQWVYFEKDL